MHRYAELIHLLQIHPFTVEFTDLDDLILSKGVVTQIQP